MASTFRRPTGILLAVLLGVLALPLLSAPATAAEGYRYWNYFHADGDTWSYSQVGPEGFTPADGAIEGWRWATDASFEGVPPRADLTELTFDDVCGGEEAGEGRKRVAVLIDYGTEADAEGREVPAPRADCALVPEGASGQQVIEAVADLRVEDGLNCAIDGYPAAGCGGPVPDAEPVGAEEPVAFELPADAEEEAPAPGSSDTGLLWPLVGLGLLVVVVGAAALAMSRRNRTEA